jgi:iron complex outermembrane receptor protein
MDSPIDDSYMLGIDYKHKNLNDFIKSLSFKSYYSFVDHLMTNGFANSTYVRPNYPGIDARTPVTSNTMGGKFELGMTPNDKLLVYAGVDADIIKRDGTKTVYVNINVNTGQPLNNQIVKEFKVWQDATISDYGFFTEASYKLNKQFTATSGFRADYVMAGMDDPDPGFEALYGGQIKDVTDVTLGGNIAVKYKHNGLQTQLAYGRGTRTPSMIERYIYRFVIGVDSREYIGNPYLKPEINNQIEFSVNKKWKKVNIGTSVFYSKMQNYITAVLNSAFTGTGGGCSGEAPKAPKQYWNVNANQYGFDAYFNIEIIKGLKYTTDIAFTKATNETFEEPLAQVAPLSSHIALKYETKKYWFDLRTELVAEQASFSTSFNESKTPGHQTIDLRLGYRVLKGLTVGGAALNIFDEAYYNHLNFSFTNADENNGRRIFEPGRSFSIYAKYKF